MSVNPPELWQFAQLEDLLTHTLGGDWGKDPDHEDIEYEHAYCIRASEIPLWTSNKGSTAALRKIKKASIEKRALVVNDILVEISGGGPTQPVGRTVLIDETVLSINPQVQKICTNFFRQIRPSRFIFAKYLELFLKSIYFSPQINELQSGSNNLRNLKFNDYLKLAVPVPPLSQQKKIVQKIEELFSEIDDGIQSLETAKKQLDIYRESILIQAFEGKLTEKWRNTQVNKLNNSYKLIESINKSQEYEFNNLLLRWKENVKDWEKSTKIEKKPAKPTKPKPFDDITEEIRLKHSIPSNWALFRLGNLFSISPQNGLYKPADQYNNYSTRIIRIDSFYDGKITEVDNLKRLNVTDDELKTYQLNEHDLIINRVNSIEYLGKCAFVSKLNINEPTVFESNIMRCKLIETVSPKYIAYYLSSIKGKNSLCLNAKHAVNQASINQTDVGNAIIPLPNFPEQIKVVELLEENFEKIQILEKEISNNLVILAKLKTSILTKAFLGRLIPQDPNDEPSSVLLERIKAEKEEPAQQELI